MYLPEGVAILNCSGHPKNNSYPGCTRWGLLIGNIWENDKTYHGILGYSIFWFWQFRFISFGWKVSDSFDVFKACKDSYESPSDIILACQEILGATLHLMLAGLLGRQVEGPNQRFVTQRLQVRWHNQWQLSRLQRLSSRFQATEDPFNGYRMFNWDMLPHGLYPHIPFDVPSPEVVSLVTALGAWWCALTAEIQQKPARPAEIQMAIRQ